MSPHGRRRPVCKEPDCNVEIELLKKYCIAHEWRINKWLERGRELLAEIKKREGK